MTYIELIENKYWKYVNKGFSENKILRKMLFYNFRLQFKKLKFSQTNTKFQVNTKRELNIAFRTNGGFGNVLIHANFIKKFREIFNNSNLRIIVFGHPISEITNAIFANQEFVNEYYNYTDLKNEDYPYYDVIIDIHSFPDVIKADWVKVHAINPKLYEVLTVWKNFRNNDFYSRFFTLRPLLNSQIYKYGILNKKTCLTIADITNQLDLSDNFNLDIKISKDENLRLKELGLKQKKFITIQRGVNPFSGTTEAPKMWPLEYFNNLVNLLKKRYYDIKIVQLGESIERCKIINGIDVNLVGKTDWDDLKILLKNALYHIDGECGMVHLREALKAGPSVVLFGPTPIDFFSYKDNINISANVCNACAGLRDDWQKKCLKGNAICMKSITPEIVIKEIDKYEKKMPCKQTLSIYNQLLAENVAIDEQWKQKWLSKVELYAYEIADLKIADLKIKKFEKEKFIRKPLSESPALQYLEGNRKKYIDYCNYKNSYNPDDIHSVERFDKLIASFKYDKICIFIDSYNQILDGQHRAAILYHQNPEQVIKVIKLYGNF